MRSAPGHIACPVRELLHRLVELRSVEPKLSLTEAEQLPNFAVWRAHAELARKLASTLSDVTEVHSLAAHPFRWLGSGIIRARAPAGAR